MTEIKDSGSRRTFESGAVRDMSNAEKGDFSLLPWEVIWDLAKHYSKGLAKYGKDNWKKGIPVDSYFDSAIRHLTKHRLGWDDEDHLVAALWNVACMIWEERYSPRANSVNEEVNDGVNPNNDGIKHMPIEKLVTKDLCEVCNAELGKDKKGYYFQKEGKTHKVCYDCFKEVRR